MGAAIKEANAMHLAKDVARKMVPMAGLLLFELVAATANMKTVMAIVNATSYRLYLPITTQTTRPVGKAEDYYSHESQPI